MRPDSRNRLEHILHACKHVSEFVVDKSLEDDRTDILLRSAVERQLSIIGEALTAIRSKEQELADAIPDARSIIDFRNLLVHGYFVIEHEVVWSILEQDIQPLIAVVTELLNANENPTT